MANANSQGAGRGHIHGQGHGHAIHDCSHDLGGEFFVSEGQGYPTVEPVSEDLCLIGLPATFNLLGQVEGSFSSVFEIEHYGACNQYAEEYFITSGTFVGSVLGQTGSFSYTFEGTIDVMGQANGELWIEPGSGTGELAELGGSLNLAGLAGVSGSYTGNVSFH